ncbi:MAG: asparagine synthase (glutamine-hydrolyzing) [Candidatus Omnitrophota bacterium]
MCGICGLIDHRNNPEGLEGIIRKMCSKLSHRGPDDEGVYVDNSLPAIGLGHRRLSIIDLSPAGRQPMSDESGRIQLVLNGEIYNFKELREELIKKGHKFKSNTDTEALVHLYEEYGEECVKCLRGMFAFAIWDNARSKLLLARDRVGKKPLLYFHQQGKFGFASEFASLLEAGVIEKKINPRMLDHYLSFGYIPAPASIYEGVYKLQPGHILTLQNNELKIQKYWDLEYADKIKISEEEAKAEVLRLLEEAIRIRLYSDVPLGAFLSGGVDSSAVVALMSRLSPNKVKTFSIGFEDSDYSELKYARNIAEMYGTEHHEFIVRPKAMEILPLLVERYGEPYADSSCIPTYYVSRETRNFVTVALNGDGGDESFAGYERYQAMILASCLNDLPQPVKNIIKSAARILPDSVEPKSFFRRARRFIDGAFLSDFRKYSRWVSIFDDDSKRALFSDDFIRDHPLAGGADFLRPFFEGRASWNMLDKLLNADVHTYLPDDLLVKVDIASMANSLECRSPFLDHKLMEFCARLPAEYKLKGRNKKYILKKAIENIVPKENIYRRKMGFGVPIGRWFRGELKGFVRETLLGEPSLKRGYFEPDALRRIVQEHTEGRRDHSFKLWSLLMLELWHQRFID